MNLGYKYIVLIILRLLTSLAASDCIDTAGRHKNCE